MRTLLAILLAAMTAQAATYRGTVRLAWNASDSTNVTDYRVYWGVEPSTYTNFNTVNATTLTNSVANLVIGQTYYFAATALDSVNGLESEYSNEVTNTLPFAPGAPQQLEIAEIVLQWFNGTNWVNVPTNQPPLDTNTPVVACDFEREANTRTNSGYTSLFIPSALTWGQSVVASNSYDLCAVEVALSKFGSITGDLRVDLWSDSGTNTPLAVVASSGLVPIASLTESEQWVSFGLTNSMVAGQKYWITITGIGISKTASSDCVRWWRNAIYNGVYYLNGSTWTRSTGNRWGRFRLLSKPEL